MCMCVSVSKCVCVNCVNVICITYNQLYQYCRLFFFNILHSYDIIHMIPYPIKTLLVLLGTMLKILKQKSQHDEIMS